MDVEEQKQGSYLNQFVSGFSEGLLGPLAFGGWAEDPEAPGEQIAHSMGHLIGFAPALLGSIVTGGATGLARLGLGAVQASRSQKVISGLATVGKFLQSPVAKSIPFRVAEPVIKKGLNPLITKAGINVNSYLKKGSIGADIYESAASLGIASGVSSVWEGTDVALNSVVHGAMFGGAFGTIGNFVNMGKMLGHSNPAVRSGAEKWWFNTVVKGGLGAGLQGGLATAQGAPTAVQMYEYILGGFFGATHPSAKVKAARNYIGSFYDKKGEMYGEKHHFYQPDNGNLQVTELMTGLINKLDNLKDLNPNIVGHNRAIEVDIQREIAIGEADINNVKSEEIKGKVMNKKDKLKALRRRNKK